MDNIIDFFKNLIVKWKPKRKQSADKTFAMEILTLVQEAMDHVEDPEAVTTILAKIQQLASGVLGEATKLLTGPEAETAAVETVVVGDEDGVTIIEAVEEKEEEKNAVPLNEETSSIDNGSEAQANEMDEEVDAEGEVTEPEAVVESSDEVCEKAEVVQAETELEKTEKETEQNITAWETESEPVEEKTSEKTEVVNTEDEMTADDKLEAKIEDTPVRAEDVAPEPPEEVIPEPEPIHPERFAGKKILYAYGNAGENSRIRSICESWQIQLEMVSTGLLAVKAFSGSEAGTYDAVILEKSMPLMNGFMAAKCIRKDKHSESETIPIILAAFDSMTGQNEKDMEFVSQVVREGTEKAVYDALEAVWPEEA